MQKFIHIVILCLVLYIALCTILYFLQEKLLFFPTKLSKDHIFDFEQFEEISHKVDQEVIIHSVLFTSKERKGVVYFMHGNGGAIDGWGQGASLYVDNGFDVLYLDYRGYGKSDGHIHSEKQLVNDAQIVYNYLKKRYAEGNIIISGTSIGTGMAATIAAWNNPGRLILNSPYYSLKSLIREKVPIAPAFIIKYPFETNKHLDKVKCPITIFHGEYDDIIPLKHSIDLKKKHEKVDLNIVRGYGHNDLTGSEVYYAKLTALLR